MTSVSRLAASGSRRGFQRIILDSFASLETFDSFKSFKPINRCAPFKSFKLTPFQRLQEVPVVPTTALDGSATWLPSEKKAL